MYVPNGTPVVVSVDLDLALVRCEMDPEIRCRRVLDRVRHDLLDTAHDRIRTIAIRNLELGGDIQVNGRRLHGSGYRADGIRHVDRPIAAEGTHGLAQID